MKLFKQRQIPLLGALNQVLGGAIGWITMLTFLFSGISAWNTPTLGYIRDLFPWLTINMFTVIILVGLAFAMWVQHALVQPSAVNYWRKMFYENNQSEDRLARMEARQIAFEKIVIDQLFLDERARETAYLKISHEVSERTNDVSTNRDRANGEQVRSR